MAQFYAGSYSDATKQVQEAWVFFILDLLGGVFGETNCFAYKSLSEIQACTPQMQALAMWAVENYADGWWIPEYEITVKHRSNENGHDKPTTKRQRKILSQAKLDQFEALVVQVKSRQKSAHFYKEWENAILDAAFWRKHLPELGRSSKSNPGRPIKKLRLVKPLVW